MLLESLFIILLLLVFSVIFYRSAIHEYTILQRNWDSEDVKWAALLGEKAPLIIRQVPTAWTKLWTQKRTAKFGWPAVISEKGQRSRTNWSTWITAKNNTLSGKRLINEPDLAIAAGLPDQAAEVALNLRSPYWLPGSFAVKNLTASVIAPINGAFIGLRKTTAEATAWVATDGPPLTVWLAHEGATKGGSYLPKNPHGRDPWRLKPEESPWISELKFLEVRLRAGNMLVLPAHWWVAFKCEESNPGGMVGEGSWFWTAEFHSPISWMASKFMKKS